MQVYWATFAGRPDSQLLKLGVGVTAHNTTDANGLILDAFGRVELATLSVVEDVNDLDARHVRPNMGNIFQRGVWFPFGYEAVGVSQGR